MDLFKTISGSRCSRLLRILGVIATAVTAMLLQIVLGARAQSTRTVPVVIKATSTNGRAVPSFQIWFFPIEAGLRAYTAEARVVTIDSGSATFELPIGEYRVNGATNSPIKLPAAFALLALRSGDTDLATHALRVSATESTRISVVVGDSSARWSKLTGKITGLLDAPQRAKKITILGAGAPEMTAEIDWRGAFEFPRVPLGTYNVRLDPPADSFPRKISVKFPGETQVEVPMMLPTFEVSGVVEDFNLVGQHRVRIVPFEFSGVTIPSDAEILRRGRYAATVDLEAGRYFSFSGVPNDWYLVSTGDRDIAVEVAGADVELVVSLSNTVTTVRRTGNPECAAARGSFPGSTVTGTIRTDDGTPPPIVDLAFSNRGGTTFAKLNGSSFSVALPRGNICLKVTAPPGYALLQARSGPINAKFLPVFVPANNNPPTYNVLVGRTTSGTTTPPSPFSVAPPMPSAPRGTNRLEPTPAPNVVAICSETCTIASAPQNASFMFGAGGQFNTIASPQYPLVVDCNLPCPQLGGDPLNGIIKTIFAVQQSEAYTVVWQDSGGGSHPVQVRAIGTSNTLNTVVICSAVCTILAAPPDASFVFGANGQFNTVSPAKYPLAVDCNRPCPQLGGDPLPGIVKTISAVQQSFEYMVRWEDSAGRSRVTQVPALGTSRP